MLSIYVMYYYVCMLPSLAIRYAALSLIPPLVFFMTLVYIHFLYKSLITVQGTCRPNIVLLNTD